MIVTPLIIWFLAPLLIGGIATIGVGYALAILVEYRKRVKYLNKETEKQSLNIEIQRNLAMNNYNTLRGFLKKEDDKVYSGIIDMVNKNIYEVTLIEYDSIESELNHELDELKEDKLLLL